MNIDKHKKQRCRAAIDQLVKTDGFEVKCLSDWKFSIVHDNGTWIYYASMYCPDKHDRAYSIQKVSDKFHDAME
jgi:hypothetical protein